MEIKNMMNDEELDAVNGGVKTNTTNWGGAHWQPTNRVMGSTWTEHGYNWYRIKSGDTLGAIAARFGLEVKDLMYWNPKTIQNANNIYAGDAIVIQKRPAGM